MRKKNLIFVYILAVVVLCMLLIGSTLVPRPDVQPAAKLKILSIPAAAFNEIRWGTDWNTFRKGGLLLTHPSGAYSAEIGHYYAPVILPQNAKILQIRIIGRNNDTPAYWMQLIRNTVSGAAQIETTLATVTIPAFTANYITKTQALSHTVNNNDACYSLHLYLPDAEANDVAFHHAAIVYKGRW